MATRIAMTHHEWWDGSGYPLGLNGEAIPLEGRITAVADVFDALSSKRPYKPAFPAEKCWSIIREESGTHFDPVVVVAFVARRREIEDSTRAHEMQLALHLQARKQSLHRFQI
jgi:putative two-component system response regulator